MISGYPVRFLSDSVLKIIRWQHNFIIEWSCTSSCIFLRLYIPAFSRTCKPSDHDKLQMLVREAAKKKVTSLCARIYFYYAEMTRPSVRDNLPRLVKISTAAVITGTINDCMKDASKLHNPSVSRVMQVTQVSWRLFEI